MFPCALFLRPTFQFLLPGEADVKCQLMSSMASFRWWESHWEHLEPSGFATSKQLQLRQRAILKGQPVVDSLAQGRNNLVTPRIVLCQEGNGFSRFPHSKTFFFGWHRYPKLSTAMNSTSPPGKEPPGLGTSFRWGAEKKLAVLECFGWFPKEFWDILTARCFAL